MKACTALARAAALAALLSLPLSSHAIFRAYVSSTGNDTNPCTLQQPCRLLPRALTVVDDGGEIWMLDSANYNTTAVAITKSVAIVAIPGAVGSVVAPTSGYAIEINSPEIAVSLRNVVIVPFGIPTGGIMIGAGAANSNIHLDGCVIERIHDGNAIELLGNSTLSLVDTTIRANESGVLAMRGTLYVTRSRFLENFNGLAVQVSAIGPGTVSAHIDDSVAMGNKWGFSVSSTGAGRIARMHVTRSVSSANTFEGFVVGSSGNASEAVLVVTNSAAHHNGSFGFSNTSGTLRSGGNNVAEGNNGAGLQTNGAISAASVF